MKLLKKEPFDGVFLKKETWDKGFTDFGMIVKIGIENEDVDESRTKAIMEYMRETGIYKPHKVLYHAEDNDPDFYQFSARKPRPSGRG